MATNSIALPALTALARRRAALTAGNPRQIVVPLLTPILFATVIAPALKTALGGLHTSIDYTAFVAVGTVGLLVPLAATFAGLSVVVDRAGGAQRELLAAPIPRALLVAGNLVVVLMYGIAETLAARIPRQEEYIGATPVIAIVPWFFAGALFPIAALPGALTAFAKALPLTHALAIMRYGLVDPHATGLHDIWGMSSATGEAVLSLAVVAVWALALTAIAVRAFTRSAVT